MKAKTAKSTKFLTLLLACLILSIAGFSFLILQQENVLRTYFIVNPQERIKEYRESLSNSLSKNFIKENKTSTLPEVMDYLKKYGRTSLFESIFIFKDKDGQTKQITRSGISPVTEEVFTSEVVYPVTIDNGNIQGYLLIIIKEAGAAELQEGLAKYRAISYSLRFLFLLLTAALLTIAFYHTYSAKIKLAKEIAEIKASNDGLTGLHTHDYFIKILDIEVDKFKIYNIPIALLMLDIDHFKSFNDKFSHPAGDKILEEVARLIKTNTRATDILARYGGEEFAVIIPYVTRPNETLDKKERLKIFIDEIKNVAERIRKGAEENKIEFLSNVLNVTISIGAAFYYKKSSDASSHSLLRKADSALYRAKALGRNRTWIDFESTKDAQR